MNKKFLALVVASLFGTSGTAFAADTTNSNIVVTTGKYNPITASQQITVYQGTGNESMEVVFPDRNTDPLVQVNSGKSLTFKDLNEFRIVDDESPSLKNPYMGALAIRPDGDKQSSMSFENVKNVSIGTSDNSANYYWSIYQIRGSVAFDGGATGAEEGVFEINNEGYTPKDGTTTGGFGIYATVQTWSQSNVTTKQWTSSAVVKNYKAVNINTYGYAIVSSLISNSAANNELNSASVVIEAGKVNVNSSHGAGVAAYDNTHSGKVAVSISADDDVSIHSNASNAALLQKNGNGDGALNITSKNGAVSISTDNEDSAALYISAGENGSASSTISANEINISGASASKDGILVSNSTLTLKSETSGVTKVKGNVNAAAGTLMLTNQEVNLSAGSSFAANKLGGQNASLLVNDLESGVVVKNNTMDDFKVVYSADANDQAGSPEAAMKKARERIKITDAEDPEGKKLGSHEVSGIAGKIGDSWTITSDGSTVVKTNAALDAVNNFNAMTIVQWRNEGNHIVQRLGDVRDGSTTIGAWARVYGYDSSYSDNVSIDFKANSIQVGGDYRLDNTWLVGGAFSYTDGEGTFSNGSSDSDGYSLAAYLSGFFDCGAYVDVVGRAGRLSTDITAASDASVFKGSYDNTTLSLSAEVGYHWKVNDTFYVEPQAELAYGFVKGDDFTGSNSVNIEQDDFQSLVGRLGARIGASFAEGAGTVYAHASVNNDFLGDIDYTARLGNVARDISADIGGTWFSYGVGAQFNTSKNLNFYGTLERSNGSEYDEDYRYSVGMSYRF